MILNNFNSLILPLKPVLFIFPRFMFYTLIMAQFFFKLKQLFKRANVICSDITQFRPWGQYGQIFINTLARPNFHVPLVIILARLLCISNVPFHDQLLKLQLNTNLWLIILRSSTLSSSSSTRLLTILSRQKNIALKHITTDNCKEKTRQFRHACSTSFYSFHVLFISSTPYILQWFSNRV